MRNSSLRASSSYWDLRIHPGHCVSGIDCSSATLTEVEYGDQDKAKRKGVRLVAEVSVDISEVTVVGPNKFRR